MRIPLTLPILLLVFAEIAAFIVVGQAIGIGATLGLTLLGMVAGAMLLRRHGLATLMRIRADSAAGRLPARSLAEGAVLAVAALLLILPGFISDLAGLLLFIPAVRSALWRAIRRRIEIRAARQGTLRPKQPSVVELGQNEYAASPQPDSPWRRDGGQQR